MPPSTNAAPPDGDQRARPSSSLRRALPDLGALRFRDYRLIWYGMLGMGTLMPLQFIAQVLWLQDTASPDVRLLLAGVLGAMRGSVMLLAGIPGGVLSDRLDRRRLLLVTQSVAIIANAAIAVLMLIGSSGPLGLTAFFLLTFLAGGALAVDTPARQSLVPQLVPPERLANAIALDAVALQLAFPLSLPLAGVLIDRLGFGGAYAASLLGHLGVLLAVVRLRHRGRPEQTRRASLVRDVREGLSFTRRSPVVLWIILLLFALMALAWPPVTSLGPVWVTQVLGLNPAQFGLFAAMWGLGALLASALLTGAGHFPRKGWLIAGGAVGFSALVVVWGYSRSVPLSGAVNFGLGMCSSVVMISGRSIVQHLTPNAIQGRVLSLFGLNMGLSQLMTAPVGALAQAFTLERVVPIAGWLALLIVVALVIARPEIRKAGQTDPQPDALTAMREAR